MVVVPETEFKRLTQIYRKAVDKLAREFVGGVTVNEARISALVRDALKVVDDLDRFAARWSLKNIGSTYGRTKRSVADQVASRGLSKRAIGDAGRFAEINRQAIDSLILDPQVGFLSNLRAATDQIRSRLKVIRSQVRTLRAHKGTIDEAIARIGSVRGATVGEVKRSIVRELQASRAATNVVWRRRASGLGPGHVLANLANLPFVKIPTINGDRFMRLDKYADLVARTKVAQAKALAQRNALLEHGNAYVQISQNRSQDIDACDLYVGRVFALTDGAAEELDVPHVDQLPNGGTPFHPNCKHTEEPFFPAEVSRAVLRRVTTPPPDWALGRSWHDVQAEFEKRGGEREAARQNPNLVKARKKAESKAKRRKALARKLAQKSKRKVAT